MCYGMGLDYFPRLGWLTSFSLAAYIPHQVLFGLRHDALFTVHSLTSKSLSAFRLRRLAETGGPERLLSSTALSLWWGAHFQT